MKTFQDLIELARILRAPGGCPWDQEQTLQTTKDYVIEEAFELIDAIEAGKIQDQVEEIGDLLFQIAFMIVLLEEEESREKMIHLAELRKESLKEETQKLASMDEIKARIMGLTEDEVLNG